MSRVIQLVFLVLSNCFIKLWFELKSQLMSLTHFWPMFPFYTPWKHQKTKGFLVFSGGTKWEHWPNWVKQPSNLHSTLFMISFFSCCLDSSHCVKSVQIRSFFWTVFSRIRTEYGDLRFNSNTGKYGPEKSPYLDTFHAVSTKLMKLLNSDRKMRWSTTSKRNRLHFFFSNQ